VDGQRVEGTWRHVFVRNWDRYFLTDLIVYADGAIDCTVDSPTWTACEFALFDADVG